MWEGKGTKQLNYFEWLNKRAKFSLHGDEMLDLYFQKKLPQIVLRLR